MHICSRVPYIRYCCCRYGRPRRELDQTTSECVTLVPNREPYDVADDETLSEGAGAPKHLSHVIWQKRGASKVLDLS